MIKNFFSKKEADQTDKESAKKHAQVCLKLGEIGLESENYISAIDDFCTCLAVQVSLFSIW